MGWYDWGNPPIHSTTVQPVANPTTGTLVQELDSTQLGTVNFYQPTAAQQIVDKLPEALGQLGAGSFREVVGTLGV